MFNPYNVQGGTATIDPQISGMNGQSRIPEVMASTYGQYPHAYPGVFPAVSVPTAYAPYQAYAPNYTNVVPNTPAFGWNNVPFGAFAPSQINPYACQSAFNCYPATQFGIPSVYPMTTPFTGFHPALTGWNSAIPSVTPFGNIPTFAGYHPMNWANSVGVNPFASVVNPFTGVSINPFTGQPIIAPHQSPWGLPVTTPFGIPASAGPVTNPIAAINQALTTQLGLTNPYNTISSSVAHAMLRSIQNPFAAFNPYNTFSPFATNPWNTIANLSTLNGCCNPLSYASAFNPAICGLNGCSPMNYGSLTFGSPLSSFPTIGGYTFPGSINNTFGNPFVNPAFQTNPAALFNPASAWCNPLSNFSAGSAIGYGTNPFFGTTTPTQIPSALNNASCWPTCLN